MIQISNQEYARLVAARDAMQSALHRLADVVEAHERAGEDCVPWHLKDVSAADVSEAVAQARGVLSEHGDGVEPAWLPSEQGAVIVQDIHAERWPLSSGLRPKPSAAPRD